nr:hypothetical protein [Microctonus hyperodae filamentous virus]
MNLPSDPLRFRACAIGQSSRFATSEFHLISSKDQKGYLEILQTNNNVASS